MRVLRNFNGLNCSSMAIWFLVASNWFNFEVCRTSYKHRWGVTLCSPAAARFASHFLPIVFQPRAIFCPAPHKISFFAAATGVWSFPFITSFPFWARGIYRMRTWATGHKKPPISNWRSSKREQYGRHFHLSFKCVMERLISSLFSWMWLGHEAVHFHLCKRLRILHFFFLHVKHCVRIFTALNLSFAVDKTICLHFFK